MVVPRSRSARLSIYLSIYLSPLGRTEREVENQHGETLQALLDPNDMSALVSRLSSTSRSSSPSSQAVISENSGVDSGAIFASVVRKRLVKPGTRAKPGAWAQRRLELHASPLALLWFEPHARNEDTAAELWQRLPRGTLPLAAAARVEPHPGTAPNHRRQLMVHQGEGGDGGVLRLECATADERDAWVDAIGRALTARAASATAATDGAVAALYEAFPDVETPLIAEVLLP